MQHMQYLQHTAQRTLLHSTCLQHDMESVNETHFHFHTGPQRMSESPEPLSVPQTALSAAPGILKSSCNSLLFQRQ